MTGADEENRLYEKFKVTMSLTDNGYINSFNTFLEYIIFADLTTREMITGVWADVRQKEVVLPDSIADKIARFNNRNSTTMLLAYKVRRYSMARRITVPLKKVWWTMILGGLSVLIFAHMIWK